MNIECHSGEQCINSVLAETDYDTISTPATRAAKDAFLFSDPNTNETMYFCCIECMTKWLMATTNVLEVEKIKEELEKELYEAVATCQPEPSIPVDPIYSYLGIIGVYDLKHESNSTVEQALDFLSKKNIDVTEQMLVDLASNIMNSRIEIYEKYKGEILAPQQKHPKEPGIRS